MALLLVHRGVGDALRLFAWLSALLFGPFDLIGLTVLLCREATRRVFRVDVFVHGRVPDALGFFGRHPALDLTLFNVFDLTVLFGGEPMSLARHRRIPPTARGDQTDSGTLP